MKLFFKKIGRAIVRSAIYIYCKIVYRAEIIGLENVPKEGAFIFCGNHRNYLDPPLMVATAGRHMRFMAKEELRKNPFFAFLGVVFDGIYVKRDAKDVTALKTTLKALKSGECVALFPEGTRNGMDKGEKVKDGAAFFALRSDAKVIPVGISGGLKSFQKVTIRYGKPIDFSEYKEKAKDKTKEKEVLEEVTNSIMKNIMDLTK